QLQTTEGNTDCIEGYEDGGVGGEFLFHIILLSILSKDVKTTVQKYRSYADPITSSLADM
ncbi:MAG TPA: hypothetical protein ACFYD5_07155, partial [Candidatus Tripitaka sp. YC43]